MAKSISARQSKRRLAIGTTAVLLGLGMARRSPGEVPAELNRTGGTGDDLRQAGKSLHPMPSPAPVPAVRLPYRAKAGATPPPPPPNPDAYEPDGSMSAAKRIANGQTQRRTIHAARNTDWAKFRIAAGGARNVRIETAGPGGDTQLWLYKSNGTLLAYNDNSGVGRFSRITRATLPRGTYYIKVREYGNDGTIQAYTLRASWTPQ